MGPSRPNQTRKHWAFSCGNVSFKIEKLLGPNEGVYRPAGKYLLVDAVQAVVTNILSKKVEVNLNRD